MEKNELHVLNVISELIYELHDACNFSISGGI